jgi:probable O-glycosylation ligase (exosortase A-associated)
MLRLIFIGLIVVVGTFYALMSPFYGLLFYLWNAYFRPEEWLWWIDLRVLRLSWLIGIYVVFRTLFSAPNPQLNTRTALIFLFFFQTVVGTVTSEHSLASRFFLSDFSKVLLISYLIVVLVTTRERFRTTLVVIALSLGLECAKQGWVNLFIAPGAKNDNSIAFLGDNNGVALGTMMLVPIIVALAQTATRRWEKYAYRFIAVGVFMRGLTTYSRGGFIAAAVLGMFVLVRSQHKFRALVGVLAIVGLVWAVMPQDYWSRMNTINASDDQRDESAAGRLHFWKIAVVMAKAKPLTGVGLNGFAASYSKYDPATPYGEFRQSHSTWFGVLAELGAPGLGIFVMNLVMAVASCWRVARSKFDSGNRELVSYANALFTSLFVFMAGGTFLSGQYSEMFWHFVGLSTALSVVAFSKVEATSPSMASARPVQPYAVAR